MYKEIYYIKNGKPSLIKEDESYDESVLLMFNRLVNYINQFILKMENG